MDKAFATPGVDDILKKIGKRTGYTRKGGKKASKKNAAASATEAGGDEPSSPKKSSGHADPMKDLFGDKSALAQQQAAKKKEKKSKPIEGVFGACTVTSDEHDAQREKVLALFGAAV